MLNHKIHLRWLILTVSFSCFSSSIFAAPLQILEFKKGKLSQVEKTQICEQLKDLCPQQAQWRSLKTADQNLWLLSGSDIAQFHLSQTGLKLTHQWHIQLAPSEEMVRTSQYIFPKLFPMTENRYAFALKAVLLYKLSNPNFFNSTKIASNPIINVVAAALS